MMRQPIRWTDPRREEAYHRGERDWRFSRYSNCVPEQDAYNRGYWDAADRDRRRITPAGRSLLQKDAG